MNFSANNTLNSMAIRNLLIYCLYYLHILDIVGATENKELVV